MGAAQPSKNAVVASRLSASAKVGRDERVVADRARGFSWERINDYEVPDQAKREYGMR